MLRPFMIKVGDQFAKINASATIMSEHVRLVDWEGSTYATRDQADRAIKVFGVKGGEVVEVLGESRILKGQLGHVHRP